MYLGFLLSPEKLITHARCSLWPTKLQTAWAAPSFGCAPSPNTASALEVGLALIHPLEYVSKSVSSC